LRALRLPRISRWPTATDTASCSSKGGILAKFDADAETLDEELEGTFDDWEMPETFSLLNGMQ
jgi:hypothetical protein